MPVGNLELRSREQFAMRLSLLLGIKKKSQTGLCQVTGRSEGTISNWVNGKRIPTQDDLENIAMYLEVTPGYLRDGRPGDPKVSRFHASDEVFSRIEREVDTLNKQESDPEAGDDPKPVAEEDPAPYGFSWDGVTVTRPLVELYLRTYLNKALKYPGGLFIAWHNIRKKLPLDEFDVSTE